MEYSINRIRIHVALKRDFKLIILNKSSDEKTREYLQNDANVKINLKAVEKYFKKTSCKKTMQQMELTSEKEFFDRFSQSNPSNPKQLTYFDGFSKYPTYFYSLRVL